MRCRFVPARAGLDGVLIEPQDRLVPGAQPGPLGTRLPPNEVCETLARRLRSDTEGEVLFDTASRGRYATDASIYQIMPVGVLVPRTERDITTAIAAGAKDVPTICAKTRAGTSCGSCRPEVAKLLGRCAAAAPSESTPTPAPAPIPVAAGV